MSGGTHIEYRVAYDVREGRQVGTFELPMADPESLKEAETRLRNVDKTLFGRTNFRIQSRTVTTTPWEDEDR